MQRESILQAAWRTNRMAPVILAVLLLLNLGIYFVPLRLLARQSESLQRDLIALQSSERSQSRSSHLSPPEAYAQGVKDMRRFMGTIPDQGELSGLVGEIFKLAENAGLTIDRVRYDSEQVKELKLLRYKVSFQVAGNYIQVKKLVHLIEQSPRPMTIDELKLEGANSQYSVSMSLKMTTFFRTDKHEPAT